MTSATVTSAAEGEGAARASRLLHIQWQVFLRLFSALLAFFSRRSRSRRQSQEFSKYFE